MNVINTKKPLVLNCITKNKVMKKLISEGQQDGSIYRKAIENNSIVLNNIGDLDTLIEKIGDTKYVLLGEASHGTHEYYTWRTAITKRLITEKGFSFISVEGDWPDCYRLNRYVKNYPDSGKNAYDVLREFNRWPTWMWANWETVALAEWLRKHNEQLPRNKKVGFYGLDVYSLWESLSAIINYLEKVDKPAKEVALKAFRCFEPYSDEEGQAYARATQMIPVSCRNEVVSLLKEILIRMINYNTDHEAVMNAEQNAHVIVNAERYYRAMVEGGPRSWNIRDHHMVSTLNRLMNFTGSGAKAIIWEHNTHIGDARATDMAQEGMVNVGELVREQHAAEGVFSVGFGSYEGTVIAGQKWNAPMRVTNVPKAQTGSWENMVHQAGAKNRLIFMSTDMANIFSNKPLGHRAIGVVYHPEYEHLGNYVLSYMPKRYDAFIYLDKTRALHPLHIKPDGHQMPETYPFGV